MSPLSTVPGRSLHVRSARLPGGSVVDIFCADGRFERVEPSIPGSVFAGQAGSGTPIREVDAHGLIALPSFVDMHTHFRTPGLTEKEDLPHGCRAAVAGGFTACNAMANTAPVCSTPVIARSVVDEAATLGLCDVYQAVSATQDFDGVTTSHLDALPSDSAFALAVSDDGHGITDPAAFVETARKTERLGKLFLVHPDPEDGETERDIELAEKHDLRVHFCHVSTKKSARAIVAARSRGARVSWEVAPHHIALNCEQHPYRVNPPIRPEADRAFIAACARGDWGDAYVPGAIATDHAPHTPQDKANGAPGLVGLETAFAVTNTWLGLDAVGQLLCRGPRRLLGLPPVLVAQGYPADFVLVNPEKQWTVDPEKFFTKGRNTPFAGMTLTGSVEYTVKEGHVLYEHGQIM